MASRNALLIMLLLFVRRGLLVILRFLDSALLFACVRDTVERELDITLSFHQNDNDLKRNGELTER